MLRLGPARLGLYGRRRRSSSAPAGEKAKGRPIGLQPGKGKGGGLGPKNRREAEEHRPGQYGGGSGGGSVPGAISDLTATAQSSTTVLLAYTDAAGATSHEYRIDGGTWTAVPGDKTVTGLTASTEYDFEVRGVNEHGPGPASNVATETTQSNARVYWRVNVHDSNGVGTNDAVSCQEMEMRDSPGGADLCSGGTPFASSGTSANAFDNSTGTVWQSGTVMPQHVGYQHAAPVDIVEVSWRVNTGTLSPRAATVEKSGDGGSTYEVVWAIPEQTGWTNSQQRVFTKPGSQTPPKVTQASVMAVAKDATVSLARVTQGVASVAATGPVDASLARVTQVAVSVVALS